MVLFLGPLERKQRRLAAIVIASAKLEAAYAKIIALEDLLNQHDDPRVQARMQAILPCIAAQQVSADVGTLERSSAPLVPADVHVMSCAAKHNFSVDFRQLQPQQARAMGRGRRTKKVWSDSELNHISDIREQMAFDARKFPDKRVAVYCATKNVSSATVVDDGFECGIGQQPYFLPPPPPPPLLGTDLGAIMCADLEIFRQKLFSDTAACHIETTCKSDSHTLVKKNWKPNI